MTKSELIKRISDRYPDMLQKDIQALVDILFAEIAHALVERRRVELRGFGAFSLRERKARKARNPRTNEEVQLQQRFAPYFRAGKELRDLINDDIPE